ncbi:hypothetical protein BG015_008107 [Linnemannia schmuckeri]|uniref:Uncharacterized protein n=1 Tax=Linnemannia schmuckeri TaxID=64567 RepID=A0A9P5RXG8_9FUNG|nr:hypothetical protein BG015_008107 [Linnemannia schmuckeri]
MHRDNLDALTDQDMEFFAAFTGVTYQAANEWFIRRRRENMRFGKGSSPPPLPPPTTKTETRTRMISTISVLPPHLHTKKESSTMASFGSSAGTNWIAATFVEPSTTLNKLVEKAMDRTVAAFEQEAAVDDAIINTPINKITPESTIYEFESNDIIVEPTKSVEPSDTTATSANTAESTNTVAEPITVVEFSDIASKRSAKDAEFSGTVAKSPKVTEPINTVDSAPATVEHNTTNTKSITEVKTTSAGSITKAGSINTAITTTNTKAITKVGTISKLSTKPTVDTTSISSSPEKSKVFSMPTLDTIGINKKRNSAIYHMFDIKPLDNPKRLVVTKIYGKKSAHPISISPISVATPKSTTTTITVTKLPSSSQSSSSTATSESRTTKTLSSSSSPSSASASPLTEPPVTSSRPPSTTDQSGSSDHVITRKNVPYKHRVLQEGQCIEEDDDQGLGVSLYQEACKPCTEQQGKSICSFKKFRVFYVDSREAGKDIANYRYEPDFSHDPSYDKALRFRRKGLDREKAYHILRTLLQLGAPNHDDYVRCSLDDQRYCENCKSAIVAGYWMCSVCGEELCLDCFDAFCDTTMCTKGRLHQRKQFVTCGKFHAVTLQKYIAALRGFKQALPQAAIEAASKSILLPATVAVQNDPTRRGHFRLPARYDASELDLKTFRHYWQQGKVLQVDVLRCQDGKTKVMNMARYFLKYFDDHKSTDVWKIKPKGIFNLAKYFPVHQVNAEISAKLYIFQKQLNKHKDFSPMQLSAEMSDSIYICTYTQAVMAENKNNNKKK